MVVNLLLNLNFNILNRMKSKTDKILQTIEKDYNKIMKDFKGLNIPIFQTPQWINPNDFITKFSLYQDYPNSITSTETSINIGM